LIALRSGFGPAVQNCEGNVMAPPPGEGRSHPVSKSQHEVYAEHAFDDAHSQSLGCDGETYTLVWTLRYSVTAA